VIPTPPSSLSPRRLLHGLLHLHPRSYRPCRCMTRTSSTSGTPALSHLQFGLQDLNVFGEACMVGRAGGGGPVPVS